MATIPTETPVPADRQPLGLPAGSVRAALVVLIAGLFWLILALPPEYNVHIPIFLYGLLPMVLVFFVSHGHSIRPVGDRASPWWLPRGFFRLLLIVGFGAAVGWVYYRDPELLRQRLIPTSQAQYLPEVLLALAIGFVIGLISRLGPWRKSPILQNLQAWVALLAMIGLVVAVVIHVFINPKLFDPLDPRSLEYVLTGVVAYYFAARS